MLAFNNKQRHLILSLGKPEIVSHEGPVDGQVRCVAEGFPAPQITWYYCEQPYARSVIVHKSESTIWVVLWHSWSSAWLTHHFYLDIVRILPIKAHCENLQIARLGIKVCLEKEKWWIHLPWMYSRFICHKKITVNSQKVARVVIRFTLTWNVINQKIQSSCAFCWFLKYLSLVVCLGTISGFLQLGWHVYIWLYKFLIQIIMPHL